MTPHERLALTVQLLAELRDTADLLATGPHDQSTLMRYRVARRRLHYLTQASKHEQHRDTLQRLFPCVRCGHSEAVHDDDECGGPWTP